MDNLATVEDTFGDALHDRLDAEVNQSNLIFNWLSGETSLGVTLACILLSSIIEHSGNRLEAKHNGPFMKQFIQDNPLLHQKLQDAWDIKKYRSIRLLEIFQAPVAHPTIDFTPLSTSFREPFYGAAVDGFLEYLRFNEDLFRNPKKSGSTPYYAKFCSIVQSSGTGKSRILTELSQRNVLVLYINIREASDKTGFPLRDLIPSRILTDFKATAYEYENSCHAFFAALFDTLFEYLSRDLESEGADKVVKHWSEKMCDMDLGKARVGDEFFVHVQDKYQKYYACILGDASTSSSTPSVEKATDKLRALSLSKSQEGRSIRQSILLAAHGKLGKLLNTIIPGGLNLPKLVIAIDEAHPLCQQRQANSESEIYRPADIFTRVINVWSYAEDQYPFWVVFASTTSRVADFSPPNEKHASLRISVHGQRLFPPYTSLGWDQFAPSLWSRVEAEDISKSEHIVKYGRPLWMSLKKTVPGPKELLSIAGLKLCMDQGFNPGNDAQVIAVLGQRFGLEVTLGHPESIGVLETAVASHLRICHATTPDPKWRYTSYPSEPFLSCAAALKLHSDPAALHRVFETMEVGIKQGMINLGEHGELTSRLLWLLAKDLYVRKKFKSEGGVIIQHPETIGEDEDDSWQAELLDCKMIPVIDWLEFVFGERGLGESDKDRENTRRCFEGAYINFSHWISMDSNLPGAGDELSLGEWALRHWQRTSAVQCCHQQPRIDKVIPIYFKDAKNPVAEPDRMSVIFISDKARRTSSKSDLNSITRQDKSLGDYPTAKNRKNPGGVLPYIAILADLGRSSSDFSATFPSQEVIDPCLRIYAPSVDVQTYPFLEEHSQLVKVLQNLVTLQQMPENTLWYGKYLDIQMQFGRTATATHMEWEHGRLLPQSPKLPSDTEEA